MSDDGTTRGTTPSDSPGPTTLAFAFIWSELRGQGWKLFAFPLAMGLLIAGGIGVASVSSFPLDPQTTQVLQDAASAYFTAVPAREELLVALIVIQGPSTLAMLAAVIGLLMVQLGLGKRLAGGEFELLLSGPYRDRDVFVALVVAALVLVLAGLAILAALSVGVGLAILLSAGVQLSSAGVTLVSAGVFAAIPMALWATFVGVVVYLVFPEAATNNSHPGNLLAIVAILPGLIAVIVTAMPTGLDPVFLVAGMNVVPLTAIAVGWLTVSRWLSVEKIL